MNELLQKHGCANVFSIPEGLKELMSDISREVLRAQPPDINDFIANYLSVLLVTREHGVLAVRILHDLCDCRPSVLEHLTQLGMDSAQAQMLADIIKDQIEGSIEEEGKEMVKEYLIVKKILEKCQLDEVMTAKVCQVARNAYRDYWYRKKTLEKSLNVKPEEPWEIAAEHTLELYKKTKPSFSELARATEKIQAAYRGYHVRRNILRHLKPKTKKKGPKVELPGPPLDLGGSREVDLGPLINIKVREDDVNAMFNQHTTKSLGLAYDATKTITHEPDAVEFLEEPMTSIERDRTERLPFGHSQIIGDKMSRTTAIQSKTSELPMSISQAPMSISQAPISSIGQMPMPQLSQLDLRAGLPSAVSSKTSEAAVPRQSHVQSEAAVDHNMRISFSNIPPEVIRLTSQPTSEADAAEVPEDIVPDEDGASAPTASVPSSVPSTANTSEVEDEADLTTSGDEE